MSSNFILAALMIPFVGCLIFFIAFIIFIKSAKTRTKILGKRLRMMMKDVNGSRGELEQLAKEMGNFAKDSVFSDNTNMYDEYSDSMVSKTIYCKHCSRIIDKDNRLCKYCGQRQ